MEQSVAENASKTRSIKKRLAFIIAIVIAMVGIVYIGLSIFFMDHFYWRSRIGTVDVSGMSADEAEKALQQMLDTYELSICDRDGNIETIIGSEIELSMEAYTRPESYINKQSGFAWVIKLIQPDIYEIDGKSNYDEAKLAEKVSGLSVMQAENQIPAVDAHISEYDTEKGYTLIPEEPGTVIDVVVFTKQLENSIQTLEDSLELVEENCYVQPVITEEKEELRLAVKQLNQCLETVITYQVGENTQVLDAATFQPWLYVNESFEVCVKEEALNAYVKELASAYNTYYTPKQFMTSYGKEIKITNSHYGWKVNNEAEKTAIRAEILAGEKVTRDLNYSVKGNSRNGADYGNSYVEINLTAQHLFVYVNGQVVLESDFVSGNAQNKWDTPTGIWGLTYKTKDAVLRGDNYETPVKYWMPYAGNVGMHDATWRSEFGGTIYKRDGSHGCINLPLGKAKAIYGYVSQGFPVVVYHLAGTESEKGLAQDLGYEMSQAIKAIGKVSLQSESAIVACRTQYDALPELAKKYVTNYQVLLDAEAALASLKQAV